MDNQTLRRIQAVWTKYEYARCARAELQSVIDECRGQLIALFGGAEYVAFAGGGELHHKHEHVPAVEHVAYDRHVFTYSGGK